MARTPSTMLPLGTIAPSFKLPNVDGNEIDFDGLSDAKGYLIAFICNHCPFVKHIRVEFSKMTKGYMEKGIQVIAISSNDVENYPDDSPEKMKEEAEDFGYTFPYLYDASQGVAKAYKAACTPDFFLFDQSKKLVYRGQLDDSRPGGGIPVTGKDLTSAIEAMIAGEKIAEEQRPSIGCNIKWIPGNEPDYFG